MGYYTINATKSTSNHSIPLTNSTSPSPNPFGVSKSSSSTRTPSVTPTHSTTTIESNNTQIKLLSHTGYWAADVDQYDQYIFFSFEVGEITAAAEVFISFTATPVGELESAYANYESLAFSEPACHKASIDGLVGNGDILTVDRCTLKPGTW